MWSVRSVRLLFAQQPDEGWLPVMMLQVAEERDSRMTGVRSAGWASAAPVAD